MDFALTPEMMDLQKRTRRFIREEIIPFEHDERIGPHGPSDPLRDELVSKAREAGLLTPHASKEFGGLGLSHSQKAIVFEEAGYSTLGPVAMNVHAPDEGNIHLLEAVATAPQRSRWLRPLVSGEVRSCFAMTEPPPGAGSDPSMLQTTATRDGSGYRIDGCKWFITGASGAGFAIVMARMEDGSASMFLTDMDQPGLELERQMSSIDTCFTGGTPCCISEGFAFRTKMCSESSARDSAMRRFGLRRQD
jgi:acyl-CoA dehydrogenase